MLANFFKLNTPFTVFETQQELVDRLLNSNDLRDVLFQPDTLGPPNTTKPNNPYTDKTFTNVSFSKTTISGVIFRNCLFVDCLFIGTHFENCQFRGCTFKDCNTYQVRFTDTYVDPSVFEGMLDPVEHSNMGLYLFQQLYNTSKEQNQPGFADTAEFNRNKWTRYDLNHRYHGRKWNREYILNWLANYLFYITAGYGIRSKFLAVWAVFVVVVSVSVNFFMWESLVIIGKNGFVQEREFIDVLYYTATIPAGVGDFTPGSGLGRLMFLGEAFFGLIVFSLFATWLVKRAMR